MKAITAAVLAITAITLNGQISTDNLLTNPGGETGDLTGWTPSGIRVVYVASILTIPPADNDGLPPHSGTFFFRSPAGLSALLSQTNLLVGRFGITGAQIDSATLLANVSFWEISVEQVIPATARVILTFLDGGGTIVNTAVTPDIAAANPQNPINPVFTNYQASFPVPTGTRAIVYTLNFVRHVGTPLHSQVDDCSLTISGDALTNVAPPLSIYRAVDMVWPSFINRQYQVQWTTNFGTNWWNLGLPVTGTGTSNSVCDRLGELDHRFYRVISLP